MSDTIEQGARCEPTLAAAEWPMAEDKFFVIDVVGRIGCLRWVVGNSEHLRMKCIGNCFRTEAEAAARARYQEASNWLLGEQERQNAGFTPDACFSVLRAGLQAWSFAGDRRALETLHELKRRRTIDGKMSYYDAVASRGRFEGWHDG